mmetsp:Transcript_18849/g.23883  ORF Transcript_18849/g.23883 Transcript_18849/m.23883 type:complete len:172 (-) Transcript_18849:62-577(-)
MSKELKRNRLEVIGYTGKNNGDRTVVEITDADFSGEDVLKATVLVEKCKFAVVQIKVEKIKQISISNCERIGLVFDSAVVGVDVTRCKNVDVQGTGKFYNAAIESSDSVKLYATKENSADLTILTNGNPQPVIVTIIGGGDEEPSEGYIPAQFQSKYENGSWVTTPVEHGE